MKSLIIVLSLVIASCSSYQKDKQEIREKAAQSTVSDPKALGTSIQDLIQNSKTLNEDQKTKLQDIIAQNKTKAEELAQESYRYRSVLIEELLSGNASQKKVKIIKRDIKRIEDARLKNTFDTVERISQIVMNDPENKKFADEMLRTEFRFSR